MRLGWALTVAPLAENPIPKYERRRSEEFALSDLEQIRDLIRPLQQELLEHRIYRQIQRLDALRLFMEHHVFAVWDFMSLLKALQRQVCCVNVPWVPSNNSFAGRLINEITLGEESDADGEGGYASHFELYCRAMRHCGASTAAIDEFLSAIRRGCSVAAALQSANVGQPIRKFVARTFETIESNDLCAIAAAFTFGREKLLPDVFGRIVAELNVGAHGRLDTFRYYLDRHIAIDGDEHGPSAERLVTHLCRSDPAKWKAAEKSALDALQARLDFWDGISESIAKQ
jgi:DUF3050 family protein